jgi:hypothetical protein
MRNFIGQDGFVWWIGVVEDVNDPLTLGRCKVRCFGYHPAKSTNQVPTEDLPFALSIHPLNTPNLYGTPRVGEWVFGFFLDALSAQEPAILGYLPAIPQAAAEYFGTAPNMTRNFANVVNKNDVLWDVNNASIEISTDTNLTLSGKNNLTLSDSVNTTTLNALLSRILTLEDKLNIVATVNQLNTVALVPAYQYSENWSKALTFTPGQQFGVGGVKDRNWGLYRSWYGSNPDTTWGSSGATATKTDLSGIVSLKASGKGVDVVIVDGVIDPNHPEFSVNPDGSGGSRVKYFNWYSLNIPGDPSYGQTYNPPVTTDRSSSSDDSRHAVHVAGTVAGNTQGWAPNANIYNISPQYVTGGVQYAYLYKYILYWHNQKRAAGDMTPTIVNNSWSSRYTVNYTTITSVTYQGSTYAGPFTINQLASYGITVDSDGITRIALRNVAMDADIEACINAGIIMVAAAGNDTSRMTTNPSDVDYNNTVTATGANSGNPIYYSRGQSPGAISGVICVGSISSSTDSPGPDRKANISNRGPRVDVFAPGAVITSAWLTNIITSQGLLPTPVPDARDSRYYVAKLTGTSMASPQVCGVLACALEITPTMNQADALAYITQNAGINQIPTSTGGVTDVYDLLGAPNRYLAVPSNLKGSI